MVAFLSAMQSSASCGCCGTEERVVHLGVALREDVPAPPKPYPSEVTDEEWAFVAPYLTLLDPDAPGAGMICARSSMRC